MSSRLALGTAQFGSTYGIANRRGQLKLSDAAEVVSAARASGLDTIDTAIDYGDSEACLGSINVTCWRVVSKLPTLPVDRVDTSTWLKTQLNGSLRRLNLKCLYGLLLHHPLQLIGPEGPELAKALRKARDDGQVERIGVSIYSPDDLETIYSVLQPDLVQAPLNLVDRRLVDSGWLSRLADRGVEIHTRSCFLQGLLLMPKVPPCFAPWHELWTRWQRWLAVRPGLAAAACLAYPLSFPEVDRVIVGVDSVVQLTELIAAEKTCVADDLPDLQSYDEQLINPSKWHSL